MTDRILGNDSDNQDCLRSAVATFKTNGDGILAEIVLLRDPPKKVLRTMDIYNPYVADDEAAHTWPGGESDFQVLKLYLDEVNAYIAATATERSISYAHVYQAFYGVSGEEDPRKKGYISKLDGLHPNGTGHKVMAELLRDPGYAPLRPQ